MPDVIYTFSAAGEQAVAGAFRSISDEARRSASETRRGTGRQVTEQQAAARQLKQQGREQAAAKRAQLQAERQGNQELLREQKRAARERQRAEQRAAREQARHQRQAQRQMFRENARQVREQERRDRARQRRRERRVEAIRNVGVGAIQAVGLGAAGVVGLAARQGIQLQDRATRLAVKGSSATNRVDPKALRREAQQVAKDVRGAKAEDVIAAQEKFVGRTGRLDLARQFGETFAKVSVATQTEMGDLGAAAAKIFEEFGVDDVNKMADSLALLAVQGKRGSFEIADAANQFPKMAAAASRFGLRGTSGLATLGGLSQIASRSTGGAEQTATAVEAMFRQLVAKSTTLERKYGVSVFEDKSKTKARNVEDVLVETIAGTKGNIQNLQEIFGEEGIKGVSPLITLFNKTRQEAVAGGATEEEAATKAVARLRKEIDDASNVTNARTELERDLATQQQQTSVAITAAWESIVAEVSENLTPVLAEELTKLAGFIAETDFSSVVTGFRAVAEAAGLLAEGLYALGVIKKKPKSPGELLREGEKELATLAPQRAELNRRARLALGDPGTDAAALNKEFEQLAAKEEQARTKIAGATETVWKEPSAAQPVITEDQFVQQLGIPEFMARGVASAIKENPSTSGLFTELTTFNPAASVLSYAMGGEPQGLTGLFNPQQAELISQFAETQVAQQAGVPQPTVNTDQANSQLMAFSDALGTAVAAARGFGARPATAFHE